MACGRRWAVAGVLIAVQGARLPPARRAFAAAAAVAAAGAQEEPRDMAEHFRYVDEDGGGTVSKEEFMDYALGLLDSGGVTSSGARAARLTFASKLFDVADVSGDEVLQEAELEYAQYLTRAMRLCRAGGRCLRDDFGLQAERAAQRLVSFDEDGDGRVQAEEFRRGALEGLRRWGAEDEALFTAEWFEAHFRRADIVEDGALDARELQFAAFLANEHAVWGIVVDALHGMNVDGSDSITREEVEAGVARHRTRMGRGRSVPEVIGEVFDIADKDKSGALSQEEVGAAARLVHSELMGDP